MGVFIKSKSASADQRGKGAWGWMVPYITIFIQEISLFLIVSNSPADSS